MLQEVSMQKDWRFRALIEHSSDAVALLTAEGVVTYASPSSERVTGYAVSELVGSNAFSLLHPDDVEPVSQQFSTLLSKPGHFVTMEYRVRHKDGTWHWMEGIATNLLADPAVQAVVINFRDIMERKELEQRLQYSERKLRTLVESNILGVAVSDSSGRIHEVNERFAQIVGYSREELLSGAVTKDDLIPNDYREAVIAHEQVMLATGAMPPWEKECLRKDGSRVPTLMAGALVDREQGLALVLFHDISERMASERRKQEFLSMVSHELRTPLTILMACIEIALLELEQRVHVSASEREALLSRVENILRQASGQVEVETRMVEDLLAASRLDVAHFDLLVQRENLATIVRDVVTNQQQVARAHQVALTMPPEPDVPVMVDARRIEQVLTNYLTNAFKYAPGAPAIAVRLEVGEDTVQVSVRDEGPGLTVEQQQQVWNRFYRVQTPSATSEADGGLGLGLAIVKGIIEQHKGQVGVESAPGQGATFWFSLPLAR